MSSTKQRSARASGRRDSKELRRSTRDGLLVMLEESHDLPLVDIVIGFRTGSVHDPEGLEGLTRMVGRMMRMGTKGMDGNEVEETIARLGGRLSIETTASWVRLHGMVIKRNVEPFVELMASLVRQPAFRGADLAHVKRETIAELVAARDNDRSLAARAFRRALFEGHPYGRPVVGTRKTVRAIKRGHLIEQHEQQLLARNMMVGAAGDLTPQELEGLVERHLSDLPRGKPPADRVPAPKRRKGRRVVIVDKPERTQTQIFAGTLGIKAKDPEVYPLLVANTAFGGTFTARLMNEIRSKRGWSYGAYSRVGQDRQRDAWYMWAMPAAKDAVDCLRLELELLEGFVRDGVTAKELEFAKSYLVNSHCFEVDTAAKRLDARMECELLGLPEECWKELVPKVREVQRDDANAAVARRLSDRDLTISVVATADDVRERLEELPGVGSVEVVPYDRD